jgi:restriction endonuclease S subunit
MPRNDRLAAMHEQPQPTEEEQESLPYISNEDIASWTGRLLNDDPKPSAADSRKFRTDDILLNKLRPYLAKVYHADFDGVSSGELLCLRPSRRVLPRFLFYVIASKGFIDAIDADTFGTKMPRADWDIVGHQPLPLPPLDVQRRIARFLDEKTARIDGLITKKRRLLDRLAEKHQALITQAVTQGLDPDVRDRLRLPKRSERRHTLTRPVSSKASHPRTSSAPSRPCPSASASTYPPSKRKTSKVDGYPGSTAIPAPSPSNGATSTTAPAARSRPSPI